MNIELKLLSPTLVGNGEGWASIIDLDVVYDDLGLPFIPARRVKGILRESALEIIEMFSYSGLNIFSRDDIDAVFGKPGFSESKCIISNFYLHNYKDYRQWILWGIDNYPGIFFRDRIENLFTVFRSQTALDKRGVAKENSLRTERALKRNLIFEGTIDFQSIENNIYERYLCLIVLAVKNARRIGTNRNRGFGKVRFSIPKEIESKAKEFLKKQEVGTEI